MDKIIISEQQIREMVAQACLDAINEGAFGDKLKSFGQKAVNAAKKGYQGGKALVQKGVDAYNKGMDTLQQKIDNISSEYGFDPENNSEEEDPEDNSQETSNPQPFPDLAKAEEEYLARKQQSQQQTQPQQTQPAQGWNDSQWTSSDTTAANYQNNTTNNNEQPQQQTQSWDGNGYGEDNSIEESKNMEKNVIKINENTLRQIVAESVKKVLKEDFSNTEGGNTAFFEYEQKIMSLLDECNDSLLLLRVIEKAAGKLSSIAIKDEVNRRDEWFVKAKQWADRVRQDASMLSN